MEAEDVHSTIAAVADASPAGKRPLLVHIGLVEQITVGAKQLLIEDTCSTRTAVVGVDEVGKVLTAFNYRSATPSRYFVEESDAVAWLTQKAVPESATTAAAAESFTVEMRGEVLWVQWQADESVTDADASALLERARQMIPLTCPPMLLQLNHMVSLTEGALHAFGAGLDIAALAIVGTGASDKVITAYYKMLHHPPYPTQYFETVSDAQDWLTHCFQ
ncbi:hypothetical protein IWX65_003460 [Arthrobacter sp. CAN_A214]|uniref:DUF7793 family protein n=1 Tax=Arthrobacter sp. CAN_A214 TaxID=2787720 RepID=UPI0018CAA5DE